MNQIKELLNNLNQNELEELINLCNQKSNKTNDKETLLKLENNYRCPHCNSTHIVKNGKSGKEQQFKCLDCKKNYSIKTKTLFFHTRKSINKWKEYIELMKDGKSLRYIAEKLNINLKTSFYWRHKILKFIQDKQNKDNNNNLKGIVEADETYFNESQKGNKHLNRPRRKGKTRQDPITKSHNIETNKRGLNKDKVCVVCAIDRNKDIYNKPISYGTPDKWNIYNALYKKINRDSILITDGNNSYNILGLKNKKLKFGLTENKLYHLNNINSYHSGLKQFIRNFKGVATKYLDYYVNYFKNIRLKTDLFNEIIKSCNEYTIRELKEKRVCF